MSSSGKDVAVASSLSMIIINVFFQSKQNDVAHMIYLFFRELSVGRGSTATFGSGAMPKIHAVEAWDGKDGQVSGSITVVSRLENTKT